MGKLVIKIIFIGIVFLSSIVAKGQNFLEIPALERNVSISFVNTSLKQALAEIETMGKVTFAYKTNSLETNNHLNRTYSNKTIREILDDIFQGKISYRSKGNYIILKEVVQLKVGNLRFEGYVMDQKSESKIPFVTLYDTLSLNAVITDEYGYFEFITSANPSVPLMVKKDGYKDTVVQLSAANNGKINIAIAPLWIDAKKSEEAYATVLEKKKRLNFFPISEDKKANFLNFARPLKNKVQFSVVPAVGTNGKLSSSTTVDYSVNLFGGINQSVRVMEFGSLFNMDLDSVGFVQFAGLFNLVGGHQRGVQFAGLTNLNNSSFKGLQFSGISNLTKGKFKGVQFAGISNLGLSSFRGLQLAGISNVIMDSSKNFQFAGISNYSKQWLHGGQISGILNHANNEMQGLQLSGLVNISRKNLNGNQISGFMNVANKVKGLQLSFLNFCDSIDGLQLGFLSYSKSGIHQLEISTSDFLPIQIGWRTGTHKFYNYFGIASRFDFGIHQLFSGIYGIGSSIQLSQKSRLFFDLQGSQFYRKSFEENNYMGKGIVSYQWQWKSKFAVAVGPTFTVYSVEKANTDFGLEMMNLAPYHLSNRTYANNRNVQMWIGGQLSIRLF